MYSAILLIALWLNREDRKMIWLTAIIGASIFLPVHLITERPLWFLTCAIAECFVILSAILLNTRATFATVGVCSMLLLSHIITWNYLDIPNYSFIVPYLEYLELLICILCSGTILNYFKEVLKCRLQKY